MTKEIKYGGFSASPNDHENLEGDLHVAMNLIPEDGTIKPVLPPGNMFTLPDGTGIVAIHDNGTFKHYILLNAFSQSLHWIDEQAQAVHDIVHDFGDAEIYHVEAIGNTLVVLASDGLHYILWKAGEYHYLGTHLPELDLQFSTCRCAFSPPRTASEFSIGDTSKDQPYFNDIIRDKDIKEGICMSIMAAVNSRMAAAYKKNLFTMPFFVRYAYRLYDGETITMHSAPIFMALPDSPPTVNMRWNIHEDGKVYPAVSGDGHTRFYGCDCNFPGYMLHYRVVDEAQVEELKQWSDIIDRVVVYVSPQFYTYNQAAKDEDITIGKETSELPLNKNFNHQVVNNASFHLVAEYEIDKLGDKSHDIDLSRSSRSGYGGNEMHSSYCQVRLDFEPTNDNIVVRDLMPDDYQSHDLLLATDKSAAFTYNKRINLAGLKRKLFKGFSPCCLWFDYDQVENDDGTTTTGRTGRAGWARNREGGSQTTDNDTNELMCQCTVVVKNDDVGEIVMRSESRKMYFYNDKRIVWFFYPNTKAVRAYFDIEGDIIEVPLQQHPSLNGAYYYGLAETSEQIAGVELPVESPDEDRIINMPNKVYTSEVFNPFYFPMLGINTVGAARILGLCAAVRPVSTGQVGYADLYIFTDNGVWVAKITNEGVYSDVTLVTGDVCINAASITQMETTVLFSTARGIMLISGSRAQCISHAIDDEGAFVPGMTGYIDQLAELNGLGVIDVQPFRAFLPDCRSVYDYKGQRIIVYNPHFPYAYIYSLESNKWGMMQSSIIYTVRAYPDALAVVSDDNISSLVNYSDTDYQQGDGSTLVNALLVTRPLTLDAPDILKTVSVVLQRGLFRKGMGHVSSALFGSRDLFDWKLVMTSTNYAMRGWRGTPYKWFRVAVLLRLPAGESISGCSIKFEPKYTNRLR